MIKIFALCAVLACSLMLPQVVARHVVVTQRSETQRTVSPGPGIPQNSFVRSKLHYKVDGEGPWEVKVAGHCKDTYINVDGDELWWTTATTIPETYDPDVNVGTECDNVITWSGKDSIGDAKTIAVEWETGAPCSAKRTSKQIGLTYSSTIDMHCEFDTDGPA